MQKLILAPRCLLSEHLSLKMKNVIPFHPSEIVQSFFVFLRCPILSVLSPVFASVCLI